MFTLLTFILFFSLMIFLTSIPSFSVFFILMYFLTSAIFLYFLNLPFLSFILLIVYVGAIAILFIFCTMLFERNTPYSGYFMFRKMTIFSTFFLFSICFFTYIPPLFFYKNTEQMLNKLKYVANANVVDFEFFELSFLETFATYFFTTPAVLIYTTLIGFLLFFFTVAVTYVFYFTKKLK